MSDSPDPALDPADAPASARALVPTDEPERPLDAHGHDPSLYQWLPVLRRPRKDGWTPQRQVDFVAALADSGCVAEAARAVGMSQTACYRLRRESAQFAAAWDAAIAHAARRLVDLAFDRAINGSDEPVFDKEGNRAGRRMRQNDRLLMFLLRAYMPERFRAAHQSLRQPGEAPAPADLPVAEALLRLEPAAPADPQLLMVPDELECALQVADLGDGRLPRWHRGQGDAEPPPEPAPGPDFERALEAERRAAAGLPPEPDEDDAEDGDDRFLD
jgi:hypothetical protein